MKLVYADMIGKEFNFKKGDRVPRWLFESDVARFGTDAKINPKFGEVVISASLSDGKYLFDAGNGPFKQTCPMIKYETWCSNE